MDSHALLNGLLAVLTFISITLVVWGLFGRPNHARPVCVRCKADARPHAWSEPLRCACGHDLARPGAVRTRGRVRRPRVAWLGAAMLVMTGGVLWMALDWPARGFAIVDRAPNWLLKWGLNRDHQWTIDSISRRALASDLSAAQSGDLLTLYTQKTTGRGGRRLNEPAHQRLWAKWVSAYGAEQDALLRASCPTSVAMEIDAANPTGPMGFITITLAPLINAGAWIVRVDRVRCGERDLAFTLNWDKSSAIVELTSKRIILEAATLVLRLPDDQAIDAHPIIVEGLLAHTPAGPGAPGDHLIDDTAPPESWRVPVIAAPIKWRIDVDAAHATSVHEVMP